MRLQPPGPELVAGRLARGEVHGLGRRRRERRVEPGDERPEVRRDLGRPLEADTLPGAATSSARNSAVRSYASSASATNAWSIATVATPAVAGDDLRLAREPRDARERRLLGEVGGQLEVGVQARLDAPVAP